MRILQFETKDLPGVTLTRNDDGRVFVEGKNEYKSIKIEYEPPGYEVIDYETGKAVKTQGNFEAEEGKTCCNVGPDDNDVEPFDVEVLDDRASDIADMEKYTMESFWQL